MQWRRLLRTVHRIRGRRCAQEVHTHATKQKVLKLTEAKVLIADYDFDYADFPSTAYLSNSEIDEWLLKYVGYISDTQTVQTTVNTSIPTSSEHRFAYRPPRYGRALVYEVFDPSDTSVQVGLIDAKGVGATNPIQKNHGNGIATLGEVIREYVYEKMVNEILVEEKIGHHTIGSYAVIDPGFDVIHEDGSQSPAGFI